MRMFTHWFNNEKKKDWGNTHSQLSMRVGESGEAMKLGQARQVEIYIIYFFLLKLVTKSVSFFYT